MTQHRDATTVHTPTPRLPIPDSLARTRLIAILRSSTTVHFPAVVEALASAGVACLEITLNTPGALEALPHLIDRHPELHWGAGTVLSADAVDAAAEAGARFVVAPNVNPEVGQACGRHKLEWYPGAATPTEILHAWDLGATAVKVFPAGALGGPTYLREVLAPLGHLRLIPTGGVGVDDIPGYLSAGALGLGMARSLTGDSLTSGSADAARQYARATLALTQAAGPWEKHCVSMR